jgi:hypothetical protein
MTDPEKLLRDAFPPPEDTALHTNLWPRMLRRLDQRSMRFSWFDWALLGGSAAWLAVFPQSLAALFYYL